MATGSGTNFATTNNMGLRQPTPGVCGALGVEPPGTSWLELLNGSLGTIDGHTHAPGFGAQVPSAGININADLPFGGFNATGLRSTRFTGVSLGSLGSSDLGCLVVSGVDLYYVDLSGNQVRITSGGGIAGTPGSIGGLVSPAAATYTPASHLFSFTSSSGFVAGISAGPLVLGDSTVSSGKAATVQVPAGLAANYTLTLPSALPGSNGLMQLSTTGALSAFGTLSGSNLALPGSIAATAAGSATAVQGVATGGSVTGGTFAAIAGYAAGATFAGYFEAQGSGIGLWAVGAAGLAGGKFSNGTAATGATRQDAIWAVNGDINLDGVANPNSTVAVKNRVTPKNIVKAWALIRVSGGNGTLTVVDGFNISAVALADANLSLQITMAQAMAGTTYAAYVNASGDATVDVSGGGFKTSIVSTTAFKVAGSVMSSGASWNFGTTNVTLVVQVVGAQ